MRTRTSLTLLLVALAGCGGPQAAHPEPVTESRPVPPDDAPPVEEPSTVEAPPAEPPPMSEGLARRAPVELGEPLAVGTAEHRGPASGSFLVTEAGHRLVHYAAPEEGAPLARREIETRDPARSGVHDLRYSPDGEHVAYPYRDGDESPRGGVALLRVADGNVIWRQRGATDPFFVREDTLGW